MERDILFRPQKGIGRIKEYLSSIQQPDGFFFQHNGQVYATLWLGLAAKICGGEISEHTRKFIASLQMGAMGCAEKPGETPWSYQSYLAFQLFKEFGIPVKDEALTVSYFQSFQSKNGAFGSLTNETANFEDTFFTIHILDWLGSTPRDMPAAVHWLYIRETSSVHATYQKLCCLSILGAKQQMPDAASTARHMLTHASQEEHYETIFHCLDILRMLGEDFSASFGVVNGAKARDISQMPASELYYMCKVAALFGRQMEFAPAVLQLIKARELPTGGFSDGTPANISNNFAMQSALITGAKVDADKFAIWLDSKALPDGWSFSGLPGAFPDYTLNSIISLKMMGKQVSYRDSIIRHFSKLLDECLTTDGQNYFVIRTIKCIVESFILLERPIGEDLAERIMAKVQGYRKEDGGYGGALSYAYATFWAVRTLWLLEQFCQLKTRYPLMQIRDSAAAWLLECQNPDGGFGAAQGQPSGMQSTYCCSHAMWMLGRKCNADSLISYVKSCPKSDGGFGGTPNSQSDMLFSLYALVSLSAAEEMKKEKISLTIPVGQIPELDKEEPYSISFAYTEADLNTDSGTKVLDALNTFEAGQFELSKPLPRCFFKAEISVLKKFQSRIDAVFDYSRKVRSACESCPYYLRKQCDVPMEL